MGASPAMAVDAAPQTDVSVPDAAVEETPQQEAMPTPPPAKPETTPETKPDPKPEAEPTPPPAKPETTPDTKPEAGDEALLDALKGYEKIMDVDGLPMYKGKASDLEVLKGKGFTVVHLGDNDYALHSATSGKELAFVRLDKAPVADDQDDVLREILSNFQQTGTHDGLPIYEGKLAPLNGLINDGFKVVHLGDHDYAIYSAVTDTEFAFYRVTDADGGETVDPPVDPVDPPVDPVDPPVDPVDPPVKPVDPPVKPVDPVTPGKPGVVTPVVDQNKPGQVTTVVDQSKGEDDGSLAHTGADGDTSTMLGATGAGLAALGAASILVARRRKANHQG
jgi:hypothetical protein